MSARRGRPDTTGRSSGKVPGRRGRLMKPPAGEPFVWLTRELLASDAYQSMGKPARKFIDFLLIEHMNHAGTENGNLKATYGQLENFGISAHSIAKAIAEADALGLVDCHRGGMRVATTYTLTWLPTRDGTPASNRWRRYKKQKSAPNNAGSLPAKVQADSADLPPIMQADSTPNNAGPSISSPDRANGHASSPQAKRRQQHVGTNPNGHQVDLEEAIAAAEHERIAEQPPKNGDFRAWVRDQRTRLGWSPFILGELTRLGERGILNIEEGRATATKTTRQRIVAALAGEARL